MTIASHIQKQLDVSEQLFEMMRRDHKERMGQVLVWADMNESLINKLKERDAEIERLQGLLKAYQTVEKL
jgi:hypothetical protein